MPVPVCPACTVQAVIIISSRICDPNRSSIIIVAADTARGDVSTWVKRVFGYVHILEIARQCCVCVQVSGMCAVCCVELGYAPCLVLCKSLVTHLRLPFCVRLAGWIFRSCVAGHFGRGAPHVNDDMGLNV